jgi:hypothetical protein
MVKYPALLARDIGKLVSQGDFFRFCSFDFAYQLTFA